MTTTERITSAECDWCGKKIRIRQDGTIGTHHYMKHGRKVECGHSGKPYAFHMGTFRVIKRDANAKATLWLCECRCGATETAPDYAPLVQWHDQHGKAACWPPRGRRAAARAGRERVMTAVVPPPSRLTIEVDPEAWIAFRAFAHTRGQYVAPHSRRPGHWTLRTTEKADPLTERELDVLTAISQGMSNPAIARTLHLSLNTVKTYVKAVFAKLDVSGRAAAVDAAHRRGLLGGSQ